FDTSVAQHEDAIDAAPQPRHVARHAQHRGRAQTRRHPHPFVEQDDVIRLEGVRSDHATIRAPQPDDAVQEGRLACAPRTDDGDALTELHLEADAAQHGHADGASTYADDEALPEIVHLERVDHAAGSALAGL